MPSQAPLTTSDTAILSGSLSTQNGNGGGSINLAIRRVTSAKGWGEVSSAGTHFLMELGGSARGNPLSAFAPPLCDSWSLELGTCRDLCLASSSSGTSHPDGECKPLGFSVCLCPSQHFR